MEGINYGTYKYVVIIDIKFTSFYFTLLHLLPKKFFNLIEIIDYLKLEKYDTEGYLLKTTGNCTYDNLVIISGNHVEIINETSKIYNLIDEYITSGNKETELIEVLNELNDITIPLQMPVFNNNYYELDESQFNIFNYLEYDVNPHKIFDIEITKSLNILYNKCNENINKILLDKHLFFSNYNINVEIERSFLYSEIHKYRFTPYPIDYEELKNYCGFDISEIDNIYITGSAIMYALLKIDKRLKEILFPKYYTKLSNEKENEIRNNIADYLDKIDFQNIRIEKGSDIDIFVESYRKCDLRYKAYEIHSLLSKLGKHYNIRKINPFKYELSSEDKNDRLIQIYTHAPCFTLNYHLPFVRGYFSTRKMLLYLASSAIKSYNNMEINDIRGLYKYNDRDSFDVIIKYVMRGALINNKDIQILFDAYCYENKITISNLPFIHGRNIKYNIHNLRLEYELLNYDGIKIQKFEKYDLTEYTKLKSFIADKISKSDEKIDYIMDINKLSNENKPIFKLYSTADITTVF